MSVNKQLEALCYKALEDGPKLKREVNKWVTNYIKEDLDKRLYLIDGLNNLGFRLEKLKKIGVKNTAKCKDANEGLYAKGTWYIEDCVIDEVI